MSPKKGSAEFVESKGDKKRALSPDKCVNGAGHTPNGQKPSKRAKTSATIVVDAFAAYRGDALDFSDFEYDVNASESDEAEETSSECGDMDIEDRFDDSEPESDNDQDAFCDFEEKFREEEEDYEDEDDGDDEEDDDDGFDVAPNYVGKFGLYNMHDLSDVYCPDGKGPIHPEALYEELLRLQAVSVNDAAITIPAHYRVHYDGEASVDRYGCYTLDAGAAGELKQEFILEFYEKEPYDIIITDIEDVARQDLKLRSKYGRPKDAWNGHGIEGELEVKGGLEGCGANKASGSIKMRPVWRKIGIDGKPMELFEGSLSFEILLTIFFNGKPSRRSNKEWFDFWAIRDVH